MLLLLIPLVFAIVALALVTLAVRDAHANEYLSGYRRGLPDPVEPFERWQRILAVLGSAPRLRAARVRPTRLGASRVASATTALQSLAAARQRPVSWLGPAWRMSAMVGAVAVALSVALLA